VAGDGSFFMQSMVETARNETQRLKAKAQGVAEAATTKMDEYKASFETSSPFPYRPRSRRAVRTPARKGNHMPQPDDKANPAATEASTGSDENHVESLTKAGWSPVAARLALCRSSGGVQSASTWLADEANAEEILAVEAAEMWAAELLEKGKEGNKSSSSAAAHADAQEEACLFHSSGKGHEEDGAGLGMGRTQNPQASSKLLHAPASPAKARATIISSPGFYERLYQKEEEELEELGSRPDSSSRRLSDAPTQASATCSQADSSTRRLSDAPTQATSSQADSSARRLSDAPTQASTVQSHPGGCSEDEQEVDEIIESSEDHVLPEPPVGGSWEWPLSREERKARVELLDRQMNQLDRKTLIQALIKERMSSRAGQV